MPLDQPLYGATFTQAIARFFTKYATFTGRASQSEYWWAVLGVGGVSMALYGLIMVTAIASIDPVTGTSSSSSSGLVGAVGIVWLIWILGIMVPTLAVAVRRLHDVGRSGWFYLMTFVPFGSIVLVVFLASGSAVTGFPFDPRFGRPDMVVHPTLRAMVGYHAAPAYPGAAYYPSVAYPGAAYPSPPQQYSPPSPTGSPVTDLPPPAPFLSDRDVDPYQR